MLRSWNARDATGRCVDSLRYEDSAHNVNSYPLKFGARQRSARSCEA